jgi:hypothetical protein
MPSGQTRVRPEGAQRLCGNDVHKDKDSSASQPSRRDTLLFFSGRSGLIVDQSSQQFEFLRQRVVDA